VGSVLLDIAGMSPDFCKSRLCWMGKSYRLYLRDTSILQQKHVDALDKESSEVVKLLSISNTVPEDSKMGVYLLQFQFYNSILFYFIFSFFACLHHIMALLIDKTSSTLLPLLIANLTLQEACMPIWRFRSTPKLLGAIKLKVFRHSLTLPE
jgi:hypothetical protein